MSLKSEAIKKFLTAAKSLVNQGMSKEAVMRFAKNEFGEITELFQKQIDNIFKPKQGIKSVKIKDPDFDDTVIKMQFDEFGPFNPKDPLKNLKKQTEGIENISIKERMDTIKETSKKLDDVIKEREETFKPKKVKFKLNKESFKKDFNVTDEEVEKISLLSPEDQQKKVKEYIDKDFKERIELADYDVTDLEPNAEGGRAGFANGGTQFELPFGKPDYFTGSGKNRRGIYIQPDGTRLVVPIGPDDLPSYAMGGRAGFDNGGISGLRSDPEVAKKINELINQKQITELIKEQPEGVLMDPPPRPNYELIEEMLNPKDKGLLPNNTIEFDDGTIFFKDSGEYYKQDGTQVDGPSKDAKIKPITMEAAQGGIAGYYTGGMVDVEPNLSDIGHGSDSLMARTRLISPNNQATTSTGLNYLLAEDNDNIRVPFSKGKLADAARRKFMKAAGAGAAGLAALKTGLLGLGEKAAPVVEKAVETVQGTPQYFFDLVAKIKMFGKKSKFGPQERVDEYSYTGANGDDYTLTEDIVTGDASITKDKMGGVRVSEDEMTDGIVDRSVMEYKSGKGMADESTGGAFGDEYDEYKVEFDMDGTASGADKIDESVQKEIMEEVSETITKKASGGIARMIGE